MAANYSSFVENLAAYWSRVTVMGPDQCWPWDGQIEKRGYMWFMGRCRYAGHIALYLETGEFPVHPLQANHRCHNPGCCNAKKHVYAGTQQQNMQDMLQAGRHAKTHSARGERNGTHTHPENLYRGEKWARSHPNSLAGENNPAAKLQRFDVRVIRTLHRRKATTQAELARHYGVTPATVSLIVKRKIWKDVR